jgi:acetylserotonin N-methyltransferase
MTQNSKGSAPYTAPTTDDRRIWDAFLKGSFDRTAVVVADDAGIFAALAESPASISALAAGLGFDERSTGVLVRLLASLGLLIPQGDRFRLSDEARLYLLKSSPFYWGPMMHIAVHESQRDTLMARLRQKDSANAVGPLGVPRILGEGRSVDAWASGQLSLEQARDIAVRMHSHSLPAAIGASRTYDFANIRKVLDVGGGSGCFMIAMAQAHPHLRCTIMDLPRMCEVAQTYIIDGDVTDRVDTAAVDMFRQPWPRGYDAVFFSNVWHDWNFRTCHWLAERSFEVLPSGGRIMLHEMLLDDDGAGPQTAAAFSMLMLLATQGQQFTFGELQSLLERAGFTGIETVPTYGYYSITTGYKR